MLDTFVLPRQYATVAPDSGAATLTSPRNAKTAAQSPDGSEGESAAQEETAARSPVSDESTEQDSEEMPEQDEAGMRDMPRMPRRPRGWGENGADSAFPNPWDGVGASRPKSRESAANNDATENGVMESELIRSYSDENISINITQYRAYSTDVYVADVTLSSPEYLRTALAGNAYGRNIKDKTSTIAAENNAILAVNGDYYGARNSGYVIRNGTLYRETGAGGEVLAIFGDGSFQIADDREVTARELLESGAVQALSFGPALVKDGAVAVTEEQRGGMSISDNPRTAIGTLGKLHYIFVVADGRTEQSAGMSLYELAEFLRELGVTTAYNLDGGGSSAMVFNGEIINHPTTNGSSVQERSVSDIVYIGA